MYRYIEVNQKVRELVRERERGKREERKKQKDEIDRQINRKFERSKKKEKERYIARKRNKVKEGKAWTMYKLIHNKAPSVLAQNPHVLEIREADGHPDI